MPASAVASPVSQTAKTVLLLPQTPADISEQARQHGTPSSMLQQNKALPTTSLVSDVVSMLDKLHRLQQEGLRFASRI